jgi:outer membrane protein assembly factor BamB
LEFGEGGSPALCGDTLVVNRDHLNGSHILAINKHTGETTWQAKRDEISSWSTPLVIEAGGKTQVVVSATRRVRSYDLATGKLLWECGGQTRNVIASPVGGFGMVFAASGDAGNSLQAIALGRSGDLTGSDAVKWHVDRGTPFVPSPLLYGDKLYVLSRNSAILTCYQAETGAANFAQARLEGLTTVYASPVGAADRVYVVDRKGKTVVIKRSKDLEILATNTLDEGFDASPAIVGNDLLLRGKEHLYCITHDEDLLKTERAFPLYEEASPINHLKAGATPVFMYYTNPPRPLPPLTKNEGLHNIRLGYLLKERMDKLGIECVLRHAGQ